jgi:uncharacterized protein YkwD
MGRATTRPAGRALTASGALLALGAAAAALCLAVAASPGIATATAAACAHSRAHPHEATIGEIRKAVTCLLNKERTRRDRHPLTRNRGLKVAAKRHNEKMLARDCFEHQCKGEPSLTGRVRASGYTARRKAWSAAEILGFENTPGQMVRRWMNSGINRHRILKGDFRDIGVGVGWGAPVEGEDDSRFATYTIVFGWRRP